MSDVLTDMNWSSLWENSVKYLSKLWLKEQLELATEERAILRNCQSSNPEYWSTGNARAAKDDWTLVARVIVAQKRVCFQAEIIEITHCAWQFQKGERYAFAQIARAPFKLLETIQLNPSLFRRREYHRKYSIFGRNSSNKISQNS